MARLDIDSLQTGMILRSDVKDITGRLLLKEGDAIAERHLSIFRAWGVTEADVEMAEGQEEPLSQPSTEPSLTAGAEQELRRIFMHTDMTDPFVKELFQRAVARKAKILSGAEI